MLIERTKKKGRTNWLVPCPFLILKGKIVSWFVFITNGTEFNFPNRTAYKFFGNPVKLRINNTKIMVLKWRELLMSWAVRGNWNTSTSYHSELEVWLEKVYPHWKIASYKEHICTNVRIVYRWFWVECEHVNIYFQGRVKLPRDAELSFNRLRLFPGKKGNVINRNFSPIIYKKSKNQLTHG